jgi:hypothetical protein
VLIKAPSGSNKKVGESAADAILGCNFTLYYVLLALSCSLDTRDNISPTLSRAVLVHRILKSIWTQSLLSRASWLWGLWTSFCL